MYETETDLFQPSEDENAEATLSSGQGLRLKSVVMLAALMLPIFLAILEALTGRLSGWWIEKAVPLLPQIELVHF